MPKNSTEYIANKLERVRSEAASLRDCFTRYSFTSIAFTVAGLGLIAKGQTTSTPEIGYSAIGLLLLLLMVTHIGLNKYASANRASGYELHIFRTTGLPEFLKGWREEFQTIGWEQAMRAWRVVQPTVFRSLFGSFCHVFDVRRSIRSKHTKAWYEPETLFAPPTDTDTRPVYRPGTYLRMCLIITMILCAFCLVPVFYATSKAGDVRMFWVGTATAFGATGLIIWRCFSLWKRVRTLERGFGSIHSCAILWQAVVVAHYRARHNALLESNGTSLRGYTKHLSIQAVDLADNIHDIHEWVTGGPRGSSRRYVTESQSVFTDKGGASLPLRDYSVDGSAFRLGPTSAFPVLIRGEILVGDVPVQGTCSLRGLDTIVLVLNDAAQEAIRGCELN